MGLVACWPVLSALASRPLATSSFRDRVSAVVQSHCGKRGRGKQFNVSRSSVARSWRGVAWRIVASVRTIEIEVGDGWMLSTTTKRRRRFEVPEEPGDGSEGGGGREEY